MLFTWVVKLLLSDWNSDCVVLDRILKLLERMAKLSVRLADEDTMPPFTEEMVKVDSAEKLALVCTIDVLSS